MSTLRYTQNLEDVGFTRVEAEAVVTVVEQSMTDNFATKHDFSNLSSDLERTELVFRNEIKQAESSLRLEMREMRNELLVRMGQMFVANTVLLVAILQYLK
jgi:hypothetical protein